MTIARDVAPRSKSRWATKYTELPMPIVVTGTERTQDVTLVKYHYEESPDTVFSAPLGGQDEPDTFLFRFRRTD